jgi:hypothetical protein
MPTEVGGRLAKEVEERRRGCGLRGKTPALCPPALTTWERDQHQYSTPPRRSVGIRQREVGNISDASCLSSHLERK